MDPALEKIAALAWRTVPAIDANEAIAKARRATFLGEEAAARGEEESAPDPDESEDPGFGAPEARSYEVALGADATFDSFARNQLPKLVYHLESVGAHLPRAGGVVICLFLGDKLHFLHAGEFVAAVAAEMKTTPEDLAARFGTGELRTAVQAGSPPAPAPRNGAMLALGPPPAKDDGE